MKIVAATALCASATAQQVGTLKTENHPKLSISKCEGAGQCSEEQHEVTIDSNWRWLHSTEGIKNCYTGNTWDSQLCPDSKTCTQNCALEGADEEYTNTYGIHTSGNQINLGFVTQGPYSKNVGSRTYLMHTPTTYAMFKLKNKEFTFDVDVSQLPCGLNGALYFVAMDADGGLSKYSTNKAGAKYGTGYCDAQCPHDLKWINGEANMENWKPSSTDPNAGSGKYGTCCTEVDIWEANSISQAYTMHACSQNVRCDGANCGDDGTDRFKGWCDKNGCDMATYRLGETDFYGPGGTVDTKSKFTVVTQFVTADGTDSGAINEVRRFYVQNGKKIDTPTTTLQGNKYDSITDDFCKDWVATTKDGTNFEEKGGTANVDEAFGHGMALVMSIWDDHYANMLWLDSTYPVGSSAPGAARGTCSASSGDPKDVETKSAKASVTWSNIRYGPIGSTTGGVAVV
jgi:cellulose 1,4-beta-cellobiosidase